MPKIEENFHAPCYGSKNASPDKNQYGNGQLNKGSLDLELSGESNYHNPGAFNRAAMQLDPQLEIKGETARCRFHQKRVQLMIERIATPIAIRLVKRKMVKLEKTPSITLRKKLMRMGEIKGIQKM